MRVKLKEVLEERNMTQGELVKMTGLRQAVVSELVNNQRMSLKKEHITKICEALNIKRIEDILELVEG
ncbi:helix-turn-helix transcriptional regulator [Lysinibacillus mangiferihumi]|uniref:Helix-turn-helix transcriptional regulator n=1 Tax=Lysinibacillus mangiferihumi TaxID=1130819 RepID=A0A4V5TI50_9BACI|nr:helix-turn-helix transcriptional regulator [Lysinibacillus mangiferihumi]TKI53593.1 helix-turn-helix transcriptional regulator [Lysinibacillus mangiferihumi]